MKKLLSSILASSMILSMTTASLAAYTVADLPLETQSTQTLSTNEFDFTLVDGTITKYTGSDANVVIPVTIGGKEVYAIGNEAFRNNQNLRAVSFASGSLVTEIKGGTSSVQKTGAFSGCGNLATVTLPASMVVMGAYAFSNCNSLTTVTGGTNLKTIGAGAFHNNIALSYMELLDKVTSINGDAYSGCSDLVIYCNNKSYALDYALNLGYKYVRMNASEAEKAVDAMNYDWKFSNGTITAYTGSDSTVVVPVSLGGYEVYTISNEAFRNNATLRTVSFASGSLVTEIKGGTSSVQRTGAFSGCRNLVTVVFPDSLLTLGAYAFNNCITLNSVTGGRNLKSIGADAFAGCISLSTIEIHDKVTTVQSLTGLDDLVIYCYNDTPAQEYALKYGIPYQNISAAPQPSIATPTTPTVTVPTTPTTPTTPDSSTGSLVGIPDWAKTYTDFVSGKIMTDISGDNYGEHSSRGLIAKSLYNMSANGTAATEGNGFTDTGAFSNEIAWCYQWGVMSGMDDATFGTDNPVTREQFALVLQKLGQLYNFDSTADTSVLSQFADVDSISPWASNGVAWAVSSGLMKGSDGNLNPQGNITRAEVAVMLYNFDLM